MQRVLKHLISASLKDLTKESVDFVVEHPAEMKHGDFSTNVAMVLSKKLNQNPREVAEKIVENLGKDKNDNIKRIEIAGPGFINFYLTNTYFNKKIKGILEVDSDYGKNNYLKGQKTIIEYTDPNPFKEFHIGHLMSNTVGESISRITEFNGADVKRACYQGDVGMHVAKAIWGKKNKPDLSWNEAYAHGSNQFEDNENSKEEIISLNKVLYEKSDESINKMYEKGRKESLDNFEKIYERLGTRFDFYFFESQISDLAKRIVTKHLGGFFRKKIFEKSEGAIIFPGDKYGLHNRVFINQKGLPVYEAKDLALAKRKYEKFSYDKSVIITGNEVNEYFKVILKSMSLVFSKLAEKTKHISHGMLRLPEGKMSSRTGNVIKTEDLISKVKVLIKEKIKDKNFSEKETEEISEIVAVGALKYSILKQAPGKDIIFDFDKSLSFEGDSGPYIQYTYTRAQAILRKKGVPIGLNNGSEISVLEKMLIRFEEVVQRAQEELAPHHVATFAIKVASEFNTFYGQGKIADDSHKLAITKATSIVLANCLSLLGMKSLEKM